MELIRRTRLVFQEGKSDKVYEVDLCDLGAKQGESRYLVNFRYGRRGASLREGTKTTAPVDLTEAHKLFDSVVVSKTNKGYQVVETEGPPGIPEASPDKSFAEVPDNPQASIILQRLQDAARTGQISERVKRAVWRAGELRLPDAAALIEQLAGSDDELLDYCIAWSLGRCGDTRNLPVLAGFRQKYGENFIGTMAREAQLVLTEPPERDTLLEEIESRLPDELLALIENSRPEEIVRELKSLSRRPTPQTAALLSDLYALSLKHEALRQALLELLPELKPAPNTFKALRRLFKAAEFRQDTQIFAGIAHLIDMSFPYYRAPEYPEYRSTAFDPVSHRHLEVPDELRKATSALAFSNRTRNYLRRRAWRTLRRLSDHNPSLYIDFAVEILLRVSDDDARAEQVVTHYDYTHRNYVTRTYDRYSHLFVFNQILNRHNPRLKLSGNGMHWLRDDSAEAIPGLRCEAYGALWNDAPQALLRLLMESRCERVHDFALNALRSNQPFIREIDTPAVCAMLAAPYENTLRFALEIAGSLVRTNRVDTPLIAALLNASLEDARRLAQETLRFKPELMQSDADLIYAAITSSHEDNRLWIRRFCADHPLPEAKLTPLIGRLIAGAMAFGRAPDDHEALIDDIAWMLINGFGAVTRELGFDIIGDLLKEKSVPVQRLGAGLLLNHATGVEQQPANLLRQLLESKSPDIRTLGAQLFGRLSDETLLSQPALILKLALSHEAQVRQAAHPIIQRLVQSNQAFATFALERLMDSLFRGEPAEGFHDDILLLIKESLETPARSIDPATTWRLLQARSKGAQRYGAHLLNRWSHEDFSIRQLGRLAGNPILSVRQWAWNGYEQQVARIRSEAREALVIFDAPWEDSRQFARDYFERHFGAEDWRPELLVAICDSTREDVQDYGRELILRFFDQQQGVNYLLKLSQHPSTKVQLFVSQFLDQYASNNFEHLQQLRYYFMSVLARVNQARTAKTRIIGFLRSEALKSPQAAAFVLDIFSRHSVTSALIDKTACIEMLLLIKQRYPELKSPLEPIATPSYPIGRAG